MTIGVHSQASVMSTQRDKVSWSTAGPSASGEQSSISSCPLYVCCLRAVTELVCLVNIWPAVRAGLYGVDYPLIVFAGKQDPRTSKTVVISMTKERSWQCLFVFDAAFGMDISLMTASPLHFAAVCKVQTQHCFSRLWSDSSDVLCNTTLHFSLLPLPHIDALFSSSPYCVQNGSILLNGVWLFVRLWNKACCKVIWFLP